LTPAEREEILDNLYHQYAYLARYGRQSITEARRLTDRERGRMLDALMRLCKEESDLEKLSQE
jgi:hypothetical protein